MYRLYVSVIRYCSYTDGLEVEQSAGHVRPLWLGLDEAVHMCFVAKLRAMG